MYDPMFFVFEFIIAIIGLYIYINILFPLMIEISNEKFSDPYNVIKNETFHNNIELFNESTILNESYFTIQYKHIYFQ
jgi:hypothetical protein